MQADSVEDYLHPLKLVFSVSLLQDRRPEPVKEVRELEICAPSRQQKIIKLRKMLGKRDSSTKT